jgi:hypothetical protein
MMPKSEPNYDAEMKLPPGKTCEDCRHAQRCFGFGFLKPGRQLCDFWPNLFREKANVESPG